jgi:hypothetical protein
MHPTNICKIYEETGKCGDKECGDRHPKQCKWLKSTEGYKRGEQECEYLHNAHAKVEEKKQFKCESCKYSWEDKNCVVEHVIQNMKMFFCLNCDVPKNYRTALSCDSQSMGAPVTFVFQYFLLLVNM